jgi:hypothetical protein
MKKKGVPPEAWVINKLRPNRGGQKEWAPDPAACSPANLLDLGDPPCFELESSGGELLHRD